MTDPTNTGTDTPQGDVGQEQQQTQTQQAQQAQPTEPPQAQEQDVKPSATGVDWDAYSTGNPVLDTAAKTVLQSMGSNPQEFVELITNALEHQDVELVDWTKVEMKYPQYKEQIRTLTKAIIDNNQAQAKSVFDKAYSIAGSKENWEKAVALFNANAPSYLKETVKTMIDSGNQEAGMQMLVNAVKGLGTTPATGGTPNLNGQGGGGPKGLTYREMQQEVHKLMKEAGGASLESGVYGQRYQEIMERRKLGRQQGI